MIINIKKYIEQYKNCIAINFIDSYPSLWLEFLKSHKNLLEQYKKEELFNYNSNIYYGQYRKIEEEFEKIILKNDKISFLCFHAGRYTNEEIEDIRKNGLFTPTIVKLNHKFIKLYNNGYISKQDALKLIKNNFLQNDLSRSNLLYLKIGYININISKFNCTVYTFLTNYGGEILYHTLEKIQNKQSIKNKLNQVSSPCISIINVPIKNISKTDISKITRSILYNYMNDPIHTIEGTIILENDTPVLDIIRLDRLNEIIYNN